MADKKTFIEKFWHVFGEATKVALISSVTIILVNGITVYKDIQIAKQQKSVDRFRFFPNVDLEREIVVPDPQTKQEVTKYYKSSQSIVFDTVTGKQYISDDLFPDRIIIADYVTGKGSWLNYEEAKLSPSEIQSGSESVQILMRKIKKYDDEKQAELAKVILGKIK